MLRGLFSIAASRLGILFGDVLERSLSQEDLDNRKWRIMIVVVAVAVAVVVGWLCCKVGCGNSARFKLQTHHHVYVTFDKIWWDTEITKLLLRHSRALP